MKGMTSGDGKMSGNVQTVGSYNKHKSMKPMGAEPQMEGGGMEQSPEEVVQQHGPATEVHVQHDHEGGSHHVHSKHKSGHEHHSQHGSAHEAHQHASTLGGAGESDNMPMQGGEQEAPEGAGY